MVERFAPVRGARRFPRLAGGKRAPVLPWKRVGPAGGRRRADRGGLEARVWEQSLTSEWESLVGLPLAKHTRPGRYQYGTLYVYIDHPTWLSELSRFGQAEILLKLQERFGKDKIKKLRLQIDPDAQV